MPNEVALTQSFQDKIFNRIREQIGELMSDEDLRKLVEAAMHKAFFEPRVRRDGWSERIDPPLLVELVEKLLRQQVREAADAWVREHQADIGIIIRDELGKGFTKVVLDYVDSRMSGPLQSLSNQLRQNGLII